MRSTLMPASRAAAGLPPTAWISWPIAVRSTSSHSAAEHQRHDDDRVGNAEQPAAERELQECFGHAGDDRHAGGIGEGEPDEDGADAERGDHRIDLELGDDEPVDDADQRAERQHDQDRDGDRQLVLDDQPGDQHAVQAGGIADRQIELADDDRHGQPAGDDHRQRRLVEHVDEVVERREGARRQDREDDDHQRPARRSCRSGRTRRAPPWRWATAAASRSRLRSCRDPLL